MGRYLALAIAILIVASIFTSMTVVFSSVMQRVLTFEKVIQVIPRVIEYKDGNYVTFEDLPSNVVLRYVPGNYAVPYIKLAILVPRGYELSNVLVTFGSRIKMNVDALARTPPMVAYLPNGSLLKRSGSLPKSIGFHVEKVKWRGVEFAIVTIYPAVYRNRILEYAENVKVQATFTKILGIEKVWDPEIAKFVASYAINGIWALREGVRTSFEPYSNAIQGNGIVILTRSMFLSCESFEKYVELRKAQGYIVKVVTVEEIVQSGIQGRDIPEMIRNYLATLYQQSDGIYKYLIIIGDVNGSTGWPNGPTSMSDLEPWEVPTRYFYNPDGTSSYSHSEDYTPSDWYYVTFDTTWDTDNDGVYGEVNDDTPDWAPEMVVGRIPVRSCTQLDNYLNHVINYSVTNLNNILFAGAILFYFNENNQGDYGNQGDTALEAIWWKINSNSLLAGTHLIRLYEHYPVMTKIDSPSDINGNISYENFYNALHTYKPKIVVWFAHGWWDSAWRKVWVFDYDFDGVPDSDEMHWYNFTDTNTPDFTDYPIDIVMAMSCLTNYFDRPNNEVSLGETYVLGTALRYFGWDRVTWGYGYTWEGQIEPAYWGLSEGMIYRYLSFLLNDTSTFRQDVGMALVATKVWLASHENTSEQSFRKVWWASTLLGDPVQKLKKVNVVIEPSRDIYVGNVGSPNTIETVVSTTFGEKAPGRTVELYVWNGTAWQLVDSGSTDTGGEILLSVTPSTVGTFRLQLVVVEDRDTMPALRNVTMYTRSGALTTDDSELNDWRDTSSAEVWTNGTHLWVRSFWNSYVESTASYVSIRGLAVCIDTDLDRDTGGTFYGMRGCDKAIEAWYFMSSEPVAYVYLYTFYPNGSLESVTEVPQYMVYAYPTEIAVAVPLDELGSPSKLIVGVKALTRSEDWLPKNSAFTVPQATITIDGSGADWPSNAKVADDDYDAVQDYGYANATSIWLAADDKALYVRLNIVQPIPSSSTYTFIPTLELDIVGTTVNLSLELYPDKLIVGNNVYYASSKIYNVSWSETTTLEAAISLSALGITSLAGQTVSVESLWSYTLVDDAIDNEANTRSNNESRFVFTDVLNNVGYVTQVSGYNSKLVNGSATLSTGSAQISLDATQPTMVGVYAYDEEPTGNASIDHIGSFYRIYIENVSAVSWPITVVIGYDENEAASKGWDENYLTIYFYNATSGAYQPLQNVWIDTQNNLLYAKISLDEYLASDDIILVVSQSTTPPPPVPESPILIALAILGTVCVAFIVIYIRRK